MVIGGLTALWRHHDVIPYIGVEGTLSKYVELEKKKTVISEALIDENLPTHTMYTPW